MRKHLLESYANWQDMRTKYGKDRWGGCDKFGRHEQWSVGEQGLIE